MKLPPRPRQFHLRIGDVAFLLVVAASFLALFTSSSSRFTPFEVIVLVAMGIAFVLIGTLGFEKVDCSKSRALVVAYFAVQIGLGAAILFVSRAAGLIGFCMLPLAAHSVVCLPKRGILIVCAILLLTLVAPFIIYENGSAAVQAFTGYGAGMVFVVGFTQIAQSEEKARTEVERLAAELKEANQKLREYALQAEELATTKERNRLAREIHDGLGHYLTAINMQLQAARAVWDSDRARAVDALGKAQTLTQEALTDVRRSVAALRAAPTGDRPLPEALAPLIEESRAVGIQTELTVNGTPRALSPQVELALYRAAQEGLTNVRKHAEASRADLVLDYSDAASVRLSVRDNGVGAQKSDGGFGLIGLRERVQFLGGELSIHTSDGQGFTLEVKAPG